MVSYFLRLYVVISNSLELYMWWSATFRHNSVIIHFLMVLSSDQLLSVCYMWWLTNSWGYMQWSPTFWSKYVEISHLLLIICGDQLCFMVRYSDQPHFDIYILWLATFWGLYVVTSHFRGIICGNQTLLQDYLWWSATVMRSSTF